MITATGLEEAGHRCPVRLMHGRPMRRPPFVVGARPRVAMRLLAGRYGRREVPTLAGPASHPRVRVWLNVRCLASVRGQT